MSAVKYLKKIISSIIYYTGSVLFFYRRKKYNIPYNNIKRILFISLYFRGDVLFHTPVLKLLKIIFPEANIDIWVKSRSREILENNPDINNVYEFDGVNTDDKSNGKDFSLKSKIEFLKKLKSNNYDLVLDYTGLFLTSLFSYLLKPAYSVGKYEQRFGFFYNKFIDIDLSKVKGHLINKYINLLKYGLEIPEKEWNVYVQKIQQKGYIYIPEQSEQKLIEILKKRNYNPGKPIITFHLTAGWSAKSLPLKTYSEVIKNLLKSGNYEIAVIGSENDRQIYRQMKTDIESYIQNKIFDDLFFDLPLNLNAALIQNSKIFIGGDSMPLHIAGSLNKPSIAIFGPTNPDFSNPSGKMHFVVYHKLFCSARENEQYCSRDAGRTCLTIDCMSTIKAAEIEEKIKQIEKIYS